MTGSVIGVTIALGTLREAGLIEARRGRVTILNRGALQKRACECYHAIRAAYDLLLSPPETPFEG